MEREPAPEEGGTRSASFVDSRDASELAGLRYVNADEPGIRRRRAGKGFSFKGPSGETVNDEPTRKRIRSLAIPPAWTDVWICPDSNGHIQATGRDARGRKQYRYHPRFREIRESDKFEHVMQFARLLPSIRAKVAEHMALPGLPREKIVATTVYLLESTLIRVGNNDYARQNSSYGLTTLRDTHVKISGSELRFRFTGKAGKVWHLTVKDRRIAKIVKACQDLPGQKLLQYLDEAGQRQDLTSSDVNSYLREITGQEITAKYFRTWAGTVLAALALREFEAFDSAAIAKRNVKAAIGLVASRLGNTPTICRKCYVHPEVVNAYLGGSLLLEIKGRGEAELRSSLGDLGPAETAVLAFLRRRLRRGG
jgi:DNA topoisomerase I